MFFPIQRYQINKTEARITLITNFILKILQFAVNTKMILKTELQFGCISSTLITKWNFKILHFETLANIIYKSIYSFYCISSTTVPSLLVACALAVSHGMQGVGISISNMISWISGNFVLHWIVRWRFGALDSSSSCRWAEAYRFQKKAHLENVSGTASVTEDPSVLPGDVSERGMSAIYIILFCSDSRATVSKKLIPCVSARTLFW